MELLPSVKADDGMHQKGSNNCVWILLGNIHLLNKYLGFALRKVLFQDLFTMTSKTFSLTAGSSSFRRKAVVNQLPVIHMISIIIELSGGHSKKSVRKTHSTVFTV